MKKIFIIFFFLCIGVIANAQTGVCKVSGDAGASVVVTVTGWNSESNEVSVTIGSDSEKYVNVTFNFEYSYDNSSYVATSQDFTETVEPNKSTSHTYKIRVPNPSKNSLKTVKGVKVRGARCE